MPATDSVSQCLFPLLSLVGHLYISCVQLVILVHKVVTFDKAVDVLDHLFLAVKHALVVDRL